MRFHYLVGERIVTVEVEREAGGDALVVRLGEERRRVEVLRFEDGRLLFRLDGERHRAFVAVDGDRRWVQVPGEAAVEMETTSALARSSRSRRRGEDRLSATMHSQVVSVEVSEGDRVFTGDTLLVLEAMKMETRLLAPHDGVVKKLSCAVGDVVEPGVTLVELTPLEQD